MKKIYLAAGLTVMLMLVAGNALATPGRSLCSGCHNVDAAVSVTASSLGCGGSNGTVEVTVSDTFDGGEGWAVFSGGSNLYNGFGRTGTFTAPGGTYQIWGVSDSNTGKGGSNSVSFTIDCGGPTCTDGDGDGYYAQSGCGTLVDCNDRNAAVNPGAGENCTDGIDNNCNSLIDEQDPAAVGCPTCTDFDGDGYYAEGRTCGTAADCDDNTLDVNPGAAEVCDNGVDDDCDGAIDGLDSDCAPDIPKASREKGKRCSDGIDNDLDGLVDSEDPDCQPRGRGGVIVIETCNDGIDNDGDGKVDCADKKDCGKDPVCQ